MSHIYLMNMINTSDLKVCFFCLFFFSVLEDYLIFCIRKKFEITLIFFSMNDNIIM